MSIFHEILYPCLAINERFLMETAENRMSSTDIYQTVRNGLITGRFEAGSKLKPEILRKNYDCAASTMREVLFRLSCDGFVSFEEQRGFKVPVSTQNTLEEITSLRTLIEQEGARLSIENGDIDWEARFAAAHHKLAHIESRATAVNDVSPFIDVWSQAEWEFHDTLLSVCGSKMLRQLHRTFYDRFRQHQLLRDPDSMGFRPETLDEHEAILKSAINRDTELCCKLIKEHLHNNLMAYFNQLV